ncbi:putative membrane protein YphA (DoxX/SURF4 family) [Arthrobacter pigmenti]|uniref:Putative membrane protein YphA (DoxX/SURF4 family) n=1 Tax=Arthrobacter pigmenti TaxID=271432 RepID=A0A846RR37_9MICC|nr:DoxX family protein [Arthrobacter pigmenti]NJC24020.1 putative membrane protein YphA (DoxX/SURF4 family) [Arthrobacter pigmenti]
MSALPDPVWPVVVLAVIQLVDGLLCLKPVPFIAQCFTDVRFPRRFWWVAAPIKFAAVVGLVAGIWVPYLGLITTIALVVYFIAAISMHIAARDFGRNLFVNASGMLVICIATLVFSFLV